MIVVTLVSLFALILGVSATDGSVCSKQVFSPLNMDIVWVMQGFHFGFQGFFVELLGISNSLVENFPQLRLVQSSFRNSLADSPILDEKKFLGEELFHKEGENIKVLMSEKQPLQSEIPPLPFKFGGIYASNCSIMVNTFEVDRAYSVGTELAKHRADGATSTVQCCEACAMNPLCLGWTFVSANNVPDNNMDGSINEVFEPAVGPSFMGCSLKQQVAGVPRVNQKSQPGVTVETLTALGAVSGKMALPAQPVPAKEGSGTSGTVQQFSAPLRRFQAPRVIIYHGTTCIYHNKSRHVLQRDINTILIGRYMLERPLITSGYSLDEYAVMACAARMDEVWVPTTWHKTVFENLFLSQGSASSMPIITVIGEAVDTTLLDPAPYASGRLTGSAPSECKFIESGRVVCSNFEPTIKQKSTFSFLSIFKWEYRKGWDVLLDAYWTAFTAEDDVVLRVRSYVPRSTANIDRNITRLMEKHAALTRGLPLSRLAKVVWETGRQGIDLVARDDEAVVVDEKGENVENIVLMTPADKNQSETSMTREDMRDLLASADVFVLPTRGEGWGLPIAEAMSMQLPVIVTNYSGPTAFVTNENAYLIPVLKEMDELSFAQPDVVELTKLMRQVVHDSTAEGGYRAQQRGRAARAKMVEISPESIVCRMNERIRYHAMRRGWTFP
jgi:glycosyltransferase involved in cell wall biosynthesis